MANRYFVGEKIGFAAQVKDENDAVVTTASVTLQVFRAGSTKLLYEFPMTYDSTNQSYVYVWEDTQKGSFAIRAVLHEQNGDFVVCNEEVEITVNP